MYTLIVALLFSTLIILYFLLLFQNTFTGANRGGRRWSYEWL